MLPMPLLDLEAFLSPLRKAKDIAEGGTMDALWEKYRAFATTSLDVAQDSSTLKEIANLLGIAQFWVQLTEGAIREASAEARRAAH